MPRKSSARDDHFSRITVSFASTTPDASIGVLARIAAGGTPNLYFADYYNTSGGQYSYGTPDEMNDRLNRLAAIMDDATALAAYKYLGMGTVVVVDYTEPQVRLDLWGGTPGSYTGLDRFGRVIDHRWIDYDENEDVARIRHGYDRNSNRLWRQNDVARALDKKFDQQYVYDGLNRLSDFKQGLLDGSHEIPSEDLAFQQQWSLDYVGNWNCFKQDDDGSGTFDLEQTRIQNQVNEITDIGATTGPVWTTPQYDAAGNTTNFPKPADPTESFTAVYDAWNRLVRVIDDETDNIVQENVYDGRGYRIVKKTYEEGVLDETRHVYYTSSWHALEERLGLAPNVANSERQYVWGIRYIDDLALRDRDTSEPLDGTLDERLYAIQDPNWNVSTIVSTIGEVQERYEYNAYSRRLFLDSDYDPAVDPIVLEYGFQGAHYDSLLRTSYARRRLLYPGLGRFSSRDPIGYRDSFNLYQYATSSPLTYVDPSGLLSRFAGIAIHTAITIMYARATGATKYYNYYSVKRIASDNRNSGGPGRPDLLPLGTELLRPDILNEIPMGPAKEHYLYEIKPKGDEASARADVRMYWALLKWACVPVKYGPSDPGATSGLIPIPMWGWVTYSSPEPGIITYSLLPATRATPSSQPQVVTVPIPDRVHVPIMDTWIPWIVLAPGLLPPPQVPSVLVPPGGVVPNPAPAGPSIWDILGTTLKRAITLPLLPLMPDPEMNLPEFESSPRGGQIA